MELNLNLGSWYSGITEQVDSVCDQFEQAWLENNRPVIEEFLERVEPSDRETLLRELLALDIEYRRSKGEQPLHSDYARRFPYYDDLLRSLGLHFSTQASHDTVHNHKRTGILERLEPGYRIQRFELIQQLGSGSFGVVWKAYDHHIHRNVALKIPRLQYLTSTEANRFLREARAAGKLKDHNIVAVYEVGDVDNPFIAMEYVEGTNLAVKIKEQQFTRQENIALCIKLARALQHAHQCGIVHRDLKPNNILIDHQNEPKIADFGLAKCISVDADATVTLPGQILGTPVYMPPEQAAGFGSEADPRCDIYSLGVILYEMLTAQRPFTGKNWRAVLDKVIGDEPKALRLLNKKIPKDLETICLKAMAKQPQLRYRSMEEFADDLQRHLDGLPITARPRPYSVRLWKWLARHHRLTVSACCGGVFMAAIIPFMEPNPEDKQKRVVNITTEPEGARMAFVPRSPKTGEPEPEKIIHAGSVSPVRIKLLPGKYLVIAYMDDGRFHEVFRRVPPPDEKLSNAFVHLRWKMNEANQLELPSIRIPDHDVVLDMAKIAGSPRFKMGEQGSTLLPTHIRSIPDFYADTHECTIDQYKTDYMDMKNPPHGDPNHPSLYPRDPRFVIQPDDYGLTIRYGMAVVIAESLGKRLPSEAEWEYLATARGRTRYPFGDEFPGDLAAGPDFGPVKTPVFDVFYADKPVYGLCSNLAEWTTTWGITYPAYHETVGPYVADADPSSYRVVRGGTEKVVEGNPEVTAETRNPRDRTFVTQWTLKQGLGFRCVKSAKPRLLPQDYVTLIDPGIMPVRHEKVQSNKTPQ